ncbi:MAG: TetR/AcrR family transcriptional regulator [Burkholderiaceae bacterium]|nr:MAG: TetR/AcrR family transcriptional regulator [Burkholderiaceae bacterium]
MLTMSIYRPMLTPSRYNREKTRPAMPRKRTDHYHHGDAHAALLDAALRLLPEVGAQGLSLRQVAQEAGLSRQAPYNHFADKEALLAEVAAVGYGRLEARIRASSDYPAGAHALRDAFNAYVDTAQDSPALFRLMFSCELVDLSRFPEAHGAAERSFHSLVDVVAAFAPAARVEELSLAAWSLAHGYATLLIEIGISDDGAQRARRSALYARMLHQQAAASWPN